MVGPYKKTTGSTSWVYHDVACPPDAEGIDDVDDVLVGIELSELEFGVFSPVVTANNVIGDLAKVVVREVGKDATPSLTRHVGRQILGHRPSHRLGDKR